MFVTRVETIFVVVDDDSVASCNEAFVSFQLHLLHLKNVFHLSLVVVLYSVAVGWARPARHNYSNRIYYKIVDTFRILC